MIMQTLVFNTTEKICYLYDDIRLEILLVKITDTPTVKVADKYYEVMKRTESGLTIPVLRLPITNTNMLLEK